jgi:hypothetical protein
MHSIGFRPSVRWRRSLKDNLPRDSLIALLIDCEQRLSAVDRTVNELVKVSGGRRFRLVVGVDILPGYDT